MVEAPAARPVVIDTNIVLDLLVFADVAVQPLRPLLASGALRWIAAPAMRVELERVLGYAQIAPRLAYYERSALQVLEAFDAQSCTVDAAPRARTVCKDPDDQQFIDLAVHHGAILLSKDRAVLSLRKRLLALGAHAAPAIGALA
ncbi:MAG TPA: putative toxin-antitoxin system toxin component, PIN family [Comamonadaceae bacterium]|nr:putative toxin-antitoxin system toxin component, PIN family [Comamonadaceae bacterium]